MKVFVLFMQRKESYEGEFFPEPIVTWDEYAREDNPDVFTRDIDEAKKATAAEAAGYALVTLVVDGAKLRDMCFGLDRVVTTQIEPTKLCK